MRPSITNKQTEDPCWEFKKQTTFRCLFERCTCGISRDIMWGHTYKTTDRHKGIYNISFYKIAAIAFK